MPIEREEFLKQFSKQALDERISLFMGAGGSCDAGYPNWSNLFTPFAEALDVKIDDSTDFYKLAQYYSNNYGGAELRKRINEKINRNNLKSPLMNELINVGFSNIWTTNFDNIIERNYQNQDILINKVFRDSDFSNIDLNKRINIFKMNGDISNIDDIVATQGDYEKYVDTHRIMLMFFKRELISSTFLFIGYSFTDHLVLDCLSEITRYLGNSTNYHYTIMIIHPENPYFRYLVDDLEKRYRIRVLLVNDNKDIPKILNELNRRIEKKRVFVSGSFSYQATEIDEYSHSLSRALSFSLLENDYRIVNGIGRRFGTHLIGYANEYLAKHGVHSIEKHLIIKPFVGNQKKSPQEKKKLREKVIQQCGSAIFVFGEQDCNAVNKNSGVWEEFEIARKQHKTIIPIAYSGMVSQEIWQVVKSELTRHPYLEKTIDKLTSEEPVENVVKNIITILNSL